MHLCRQLLRVATALAVAGVLLLGVAHAQEDPAAMVSRDLLQTGPPPSPQDCVVTKCSKQLAACTANPQCALGLACQVKCTPAANPAKPQVWLACVIACLYRYTLYNPRAAALNTCVVKNKCAAPVPSGTPRICLPPKDGPAKLKAEDLRGRYNVLAGATRLMDCQPAQFRFGFPKAGFYTYQEYPGYIKPEKLITLPPYKFLGYKDGFTTNQGVVAGLPDTNKYVVLDATAGNKFVLLMYCNQGTNVFGGYVLGKEATSIPRAVRKRFAKKLVSSVWAAYYDMPLRSFCRIKARKFP